MSKRVALVHNLLIHYRVPLFNLLSKNPEFKFDFYFSAIHPWMQTAALTEKQYRPRFHFVLLKGLRLPEYNYLSLSLLCWLSNRYDAYLGSANPDCWVAFLVAKLFRKPFILWEERWEQPRSILGRLVQPIQVLIVRKADLIIVPGSRSFSYFANVLRDDSASRIVLAPNASTLEKPSRRRVRDFRKKYGIPSHSKVVLYLGRLLARKGVRILVGSFARLESEFQDEVFLLIAGEGDDKESLESLSRQLNARNVRFSDFVDDQAACIAVSDILVLPSVSGEVWGLIVNEAVSIGKPVVATKIVGCAYDVVERFQCGYVVEEGDSDGLYRAIRKILIERKIAAAMSANGILATETTLNFEKMAQGFVRAIQRTLSKSQRSTSSSSYTKGIGKKRNES